MSRGYLKAIDTISGQEAIARMTVKHPDGTTSIEDMFFGKDLDATVNINKTVVRTLGKRGDQHKPSGWSGEGVLTIYYITSLYRKMALQYIKQGIPVYFDILVTNEDPAAGVGRQTTILRDCTLDSVTFARFDVEQEVLEEDVNFTFDDVDLLDEFGKPILASI